MQNKMNLTDKERMILNRCEGRNDKATIRNITRMLRFLPMEDLDAAMSVIVKLHENRRERRVRALVTETAERMPEKLSIARAYFLIGSTCQLHCFAV